MKIAQRQPRRFLIGAVLAAPLIALVSPSVGQARGKRGPHAGLCDRLQCTEDQRINIAAIAVEGRREIEADQARITSYRSQMADEFAKDNPSTRVLRRLQRQIDKHKRAIGERRLETMLDIHDELTSSQRQQLAEIIKAGESGPRRRRGGGPPFGRGPRK